MPNLDLDELGAQRAAEQEVSGDPEDKTVTFRGQEFVLPQNLELAVLRGFNENKLVDVMKMLFAEQYESFEALRPDRDDLVALVTNINVLYGVSAGKSNASREPSKTSGARSRRTSKRSTS